MPRYLVKYDSVCVCEAPSQIQGLTPESVGMKFPSASIYQELLSAARVMLTYLLQNSQGPCRQT